MGDYGTQTRFIDQQAAELAALKRERDSLRDALSLMREQYERANQSGWNAIVMTRAIEDADDIANEILAKLESGELRKPSR